MDTGRALTIGKTTVRETLADDVGMLAASLAYRFLLALFPFFIFLGAVSGGIADLFDVRNPTTSIMEAIGDALPADARSIIEGQLATVLDSNSPGLLSLGLVGALWAAAGGMGATIKAMNRAYDVEETRPFWKRYALAIGLTVLGGVFSIGAFVLVVVGGFLVREVVEAMGGGPAVDIALDVARYAVAGALLVGGAAFLYWAAPNAGLPFRWITPGAVVFVVVWGLATAGFGFYVSSFASYNATYGTLGGVVILMVWFYLTAYVLLFGAELNAVVGRVTRPEQTPANTEPDAEPRATTEAARRSRPAPEARAGAQRAVPPTRQPSRGGALLNAFVAALVLRRAAARQPR